MSDPDVGILEEEVKKLTHRIERRDRFIAIYAWHKTKTCSWPVTKCDCGYQAAKWNLDLAKGQEAQP